VEWYLSVFEQRDVLEQSVNDLLDVNGWDLKKALYLLYKSNPSLLEWLQSPIVYLENYTVAERLRELAPQYFSALAAFHHYLSMAKGNFRHYLQGDSVKIKKYFYVLRPILACRWILQYGTMPPMLFEELVEGTLNNVELVNEIQRLLERKKSGDELDMGPPISSIQQFINDQLLDLGTKGHGLSAAVNKSMDDLNNMFRNALHEVWA
jgi:predicted nucleotidyltransferase